jgi:hypothetical protein
MFPGCDYCTNTKSQIHLHHIIPREMGGSNKKWNTIYLCPTHHSFIFIPTSKSGIHSIKSKESIIIQGWRITTEGRMLEYINTSGELSYHLPPI